MEPTDYTVTECKNHMRGVSTNILVEIFEDILKERGYDDQEQLHLFEDLERAYE